MQELVAIFNTFGPWGGMVITVAILYSRRHLATGRELEQEKERYVELQKERERERADLHKRIVELQSENKFWQDIAWSNTRITDKVVGALPKRKEPGT